MSSHSAIKSFNKLYNDYFQQFTRFANSYVKDYQIAEDIVSEAFVAYWENIEKLSPDSYPHAYILTIVKNKCINHLKHIRIKKLAEKELVNNADWRLKISLNTLEAFEPSFIFSNEIQQIVKLTLNKLPKKTQKIFILSRYEGLSYKEIAKIMSLSVKSIEFHISKALNRFRVVLKDFILIASLLLFL